MELTELPFVFVLISKSRQYFFPWFEGSIKMSVWLIQVVDESKDKLWCYSLAPRPYILAICLTHSCNKNKYNSG